MNKKYYFDVTINTVANDPVDIRCGGPQYLGFDFRVRQNGSMTEKELDAKIKSILKDENVSYISVSIHKYEIKEPRYWSLSAIRKEIHEQKDKL